MKALALFPAAFTLVVNTETSPFVTFVETISYAEISFGIQLGLA